MSRVVITSPDRQRPGVQARRCGGGVGRAGDSARLERSGCLVIGWRPVSEQGRHGRAVRRVQRGSVSKLGLGGTVSEQLGLGK